MKGGEGRGEKRGGEGEGRGEKKRGGEGKGGERKRGEGRGRGGERKRGEGRGREGREKRGGEGNDCVCLTQTALPTSEGDKSPHMLDRGKTVLKPSLNASTCLATPLTSVQSTTNCHQ